MGEHGGGQTYGGTHARPRARARVTNRATPIVTEQTRGQARGGGQYTTPTYGRPTAGPRVTPLDVVHNLALRKRTKATSDIAGPIAKTLIAGTEAAPFLLPETRIPAGLGLAGYSLYKATQHPLAALRQKGPGGDVGLGDVTAPRAVREFPLAFSFEHALGGLLPRAGFSEPVDKTATPGRRFAGGLAPSPPRRTAFGAALPHGVAAPGMRPTGRRIDVLHGVPHTGSHALNLGIQLGLLPRDLAVGSVEGPLQVGKQWLTHPLRTAEQRLHPTGLQQGIITPGQYTEGMGQWARATEEHMLKAQALHERVDPVWQMHARGLLKAVQPQAAKDAASAARNSLLAANHLYTHARFMESTTGDPATMGFWHDLANQIGTQQTRLQDALGGDMYPGQKVTPQSFSRFISKTKQAHGMLESQFRKSFEAHRDANVQANTELNLRRRMGSSQDPWLELRQNPSLYPQPLGPEYAKMPQLNPEARFPGGVIGPEAFRPGPARKPLPPGFISWGGKGKGEPLGTGPHSNIEPVPPKEFLAPMSRQNVPISYYQRRPPEATQFYEPQIYKRMYDGLRQAGWSPEGAMEAIQTNVNRMWMVAKERGLGTEIPAETLRSKQTFQQRLRQGQTGAGYPGKSPRFGYQGPLPDAPGFGPFDIAPNVRGVWRAISKQIEPQARIKPGGRNKPMQIGAPETILGRGKHPMGPEQADPLLYKGMMEAATEQAGAKAAHPISPPGPDEIMQMMKNAGIDLRQGQLPETTPKTPGTRIPRKLRNKLRRSRKKRGMGG